MLHTRICDLLGIVHPIVLGGMATATSVPLVAAVSNAGGLGILGATGFSPSQMREQTAAITQLRRSHLWSTSFSLPDGGSGFRRSPGGPAASNFVRLGAS
jgi:NAD(P)H-dependent flavin oxidoreductase YrpB (nitropropane dioxygenase family)